VLVGLTALPQECRRPDFYVMPRDAVAIAVHLHYEGFLAYGGKPTKRRTLRREWAPARFLERWDLLEAPAHEAVGLLPDSYRDWAVEFGLPPGAVIP
jgi:hypothetical protein